MYSYDGRIRLYNTSGQNLTKYKGQEMAPYKTVTHKMKLDTPTLAEWHPRLDGIFMVGSYKVNWKCGPNSYNHQRRQIDVFSEKGDSFPMKYLGTVCSIVKCHPTEDIIVGADAYRGVHVFKEQS